MHLYASFRLLTRAANRKQAASSVIKRVLWPGIGSAKSINDKRGIGVKQA